MERREFVDQKLELKFGMVRDFVRGHRDAFSRQGSVVSSWRTYHGHRLGPFFSLRYRVEGRQAAIYLGRCVALAERVNALLEEIQQDRKLARLKRYARAELRRYKESWRRDLAAVGLQLKGAEVRGWRTLGPPTAQSRAIEVGKDSCTEWR